MRMRLLRALPLLLPVAAQAQTITQRENTPPYTAATTTTSTDGQNRTLSVPIVSTMAAPGSGAGGTTQGSTTAGQSGTLTLCAVTNGTQTYTAGQTQPCNLTTGGRLMTARPDQITSGTIAGATNGSTFAIPLINGAGIGGVTITGLTGSGVTLTPRGSYDGTTFTVAPVFQVGAKTSTNTITTDGQYRFDAAGRQSFQFVGNGAGTGTITLASTVSVAPFFTPAPTLDANGYLTLNNAAFGSNCLVVSGDQAYTVGSQVQVQCAPSGGLKVGVSYNSNITPAAPIVSQLNSALVAGKYFATRPAWSDGYTGALQVDATGNLFINNATLSPGASTSANQSTQITAEQAIQANQTNKSQLTQITGPTGLVATTGAPSATNLALSENALTTRGTLYWYRPATNDLALAPGEAGGLYTIAQPVATASSGGAYTAVQGATSVVLKNAAGNLFGINLVNSTAAGFVVVYNATAAPASGTALSAANAAYCYQVAASTSYDKAFPVPVALTAGITLLFSTSCTTYTPVSTAPILISGQVK